MGASYVSAPFSIASSATNTAFYSGSTLPHKFNPPTATKPPLRLLPTRPPNSSSKAGKPSDAPDRDAKARS